MKILYIEHYAGSTSMGMEFRPYYLAREWMENGHDVRIIAADYSHLRMNNPPVMADYSRTVVDGIEFEWIHTHQYDGNGAQRAMTMLIFCQKLWFKARTIAASFMPDIVISSSTYPFDTWPAQRIARYAKAKYVHEAHDIWPLTLTELGGISPLNPFVWLMQRAENSAYKHANTVISLFPNALAHMQKHGLKDQSRFCYIPNGIVESMTEAQDVPSSVKDAFLEARAAGCFVVCYLGGHSLSNALDTLLDAAIEMKDEKVCFLLIGKGIEKEQLIAKARENGCDNVRFLDPVPKESVPAILRSADALYVGLRPCSLYRFGVSLNKVYDYMLSGRPVLYGIEAANNEVREAGCGISVKAGDAASLVTGIRKIMAMPPCERDEMGRRGQQWVRENRSYALLAKKFLSELYQ